MPVDGIEQFVTEFKAERDEKVAKGVRTYGYVTKSRLDSVEKELLLVIDQYIKDAKVLLKMPCFCYGEVLCPLLLSDLPT